MRASLAVATLGALLALSLAHDSARAGLPPVGGFAASAGPSTAGTSPVVAAPSGVVPSTASAAANQSSNPNDPLGLVTQAKLALAAPCAMNAGPVSQLLNKVQADLMAPVVQWGGRSYQLALLLYFFTSTFALVWFLVYVVPKAHHPADLFRSLAFKVLSFGVFLFLIQWAAGQIPGHLGDPAVSQVNNITANATIYITGGQAGLYQNPDGTRQNLTPGGLLSNGYCNAMKITSAPMLAIISQWSPSDFGQVLTSAGNLWTTTIPVLIAAGMCMVVFIVLAAHLFLVQFAGAFLAIAGVVILGFSGSPWTMPFAEGYWRFVWTNAISQFSLLLIAMFANKMVDASIVNLVAGLGANGTIFGLYGSMLLMIVVFGFTLAMAIAGPRFAVSLLSGAPALQMSDVISAGAASVGTVAMLATGAAGLAARAGLAAGAAGAGAGNVLAAGARRQTLGANVVGAGAATARHAPSEGLTVGLVTTKRSASPSASSAAKPSGTKQTTARAGASAATAKANTAGVAAEVAAAAAEVSGDVGAASDGGASARAQSGASAIESAASGLAMAATNEPALVPAMAAATWSTASTAPSAQLEAIGSAADSLSTHAAVAADHAGHTSGGQVVAHKTRALAHGAAILAGAARSLAASGTASVGSVAAVRGAAQAIAQLGRTTSNSPRMVAAALTQASAHLAGVSRILAATPGVPTSVAAQFVQGADMLATSAHSVSQIPAASAVQPAVPAPELVPASTYSSADPGGALLPDLTPITSATELPHPSLRDDANARPTQTATPRPLDFRREFYQNLQHLLKDHSGSGNGPAIAHLGDHLH